MITVNRIALAAALDRCSKVADPRSPLAAAQHCLIECDGELRYRATNMSSEVSGTIAAKGSGSFCVKPREFASALSALSGDDVKIKVAADHVQLTGDTKRSFKLESMSGADFPAAIGVSGDAVEIDAGELARLISKVVFSANPDKSRAGQNLVRLVEHAGGLRIAAFDGFRMAMVDAPGVTAIDMAIQLDVARLLTQAKEGALRVSRNERGAAFNLGNERTESLFPQGDFPVAWLTQAEAFTPGDVIAVESERLLDCVKAVQRVDSDRDMKLTFSESALIVEATGSGSARDEIEVECEKPCELWLNAQYMIDALSVVSGDVKLAFGPGPTDPFQLIQTDWRAVIMPMHPETVGARKSK